MTVLHKPDDKYLLILIPTLSEGDSWVRFMSEFIEFLSQQANDKIPQKTKMVIYVQII